MNAVIPTKDIGGVASRSIKSKPNWPIRPLRRVFFDTVTEKPHHLTILAWD
jgi:hypothetical protein